MAGQSDPTPSLQQAADLIQQNRLDAAIQVLTQHLAQQGTDPSAELLLAEAWGKQGDSQRALNHASRAAELAPRNAVAHGMRGIYLLRLGQPDTAVGAFEAATRLSPADPDTWLRLGAALLHVGRSGAAATAFERAVALAPDQPAARAQAAQSHQTAGNYAAAVRHFAAARALAPGDAGLRIALANAHRLNRDPTAAIAVLEACVHELGDSAQLQEGLGYLHLVLGHEAAAKCHYEAALALDPGETNALLGLSRLKDADADLAARVAARLSGPALTESDRIALLFARARLFDAEGKYDAAMESYREGNRHKRTQLRYDIGEEAKTFARIKAAFPAPPTTVPEPSGMQSDLQPLFVVGMPRSGTTLVEQILASHPAVEAGGELPFIMRLIGDWPDRPGGGRRYPEDINALSTDELRQLGRDYLEKVAPLAAGRPWVVDKMPYNFQHLGLIARILPQAQIIHCRRDPMDVCLSNFVTLFNGAAAAFSYDLEELAQYHKLYEDLMAHWRTALATPVFELRYEELVADQEATSRRLLSFCGLPWDDRVLNFQDSQRPVMTASSLQVRQGLYGSAVGKWRRYAAALGPLKAGLGVTDEADGGV